MERASTTPASSPSRSGSRGGVWVAAQFALMALFAGGAFVPPRWPDALRVVGVPLAVLGAGAAVWALRALGSALTPFPRPREDAELVQGGPYRFVRHPVYGGGVLFFLGLGLAASVAATVCTLALAALWWGKSSVEERHLEARFPEYAAYRRRVRRRLLPLLL